MPYKRGKRGRRPYKKHKRMYKKKRRNSSGFVGKNMVRYTPAVPRHGIPAIFPDVWYNKMSGIQSTEILASAALSFNVQSLIINNINDGASDYLSKNFMYALYKTACIYAYTVKVEMINLSDGHPLIWGIMPFSTSDAPTNIEEALAQPQTTFVTLGPERASRSQYTLTKYVDLRKQLGLNVLNEVDFASTNGNSPARQVRFYIYAGDETTDTPVLDAQYTTRITAWVRWTDRVLLS